MLKLAISISIFSLFLTSAEAFQGGFISSSNNNYAIPVSKIEDAQVYFYEKSPKEAFDELFKAERNFLPPPSGNVKNEIVKYLISEGENVKNWDDLKDSISYDNFRREIFIAVSGKVYTFKRDNGGLIKRLE